MKRLIVTGLESVCALADRTPVLRRLIGCPRGLALLSSRLDERWNTGVWRPVE